MSDRTAKSFTVSTSTGLVTAYDTAPTYSKPQANGGDSMGTSDGGQSGQTLSGAAVSDQLVAVVPHICQHKKAKVFLNVTFRHCHR